MGHAATASYGDDQGPVATGGNAGGGQGRAAVTGGPGAGGPPVLPEVIVPLATLLGRAERPGDNRLLGPLDPALARDLAAAAARSPYTRWEVTIVDDQGYAVGHGIARPRRRRRQAAPPPGPASARCPRG